MKKKKKIILIAAAASGLETVALAKTDLRRTLSISGVVESGNTENVFAATQAPVLEILAQPGDVVAAGDVLARLDVHGLENDLAQAQLNKQSAANTAAEENRVRANAITDAQTKLDAARLAYEKQQLAVAKAQQDLADAEKEAAAPFDSYKSDQAVRDAKAMLDRRTSELTTALGDYAKAGLFYDGYTYKNKIADAETALTRKRADLAETQAALDRANTDLTRAKDDAVKSEKTKLDTAQKARDDAQRAYDKAVEDRAHAGQDAIDSAAKNLAKAKNALDDAQKQLAIAKNSVESAQNALAQAKTKPINPGIPAQLQALNIEKLQEQLARGEIVAAAGGVVAKVNCTVGAVPQGALFVLEDTENLYLSAKVKEYDLASLAIGQEIAVTTDATGNAQYTAEITYLSPVAVSAAGSTSVEFELRARLHPTESADSAGTPDKPDEKIKIGMNAFLNMTTQSRENVFAVPVSALVTDGEGSHIVILQAGQKVNIPVTPGMKTSAQVEIDGAALQPGMAVLKDPNGTLSKGGGNGSGFPGLGG